MTGPGQRFGPYEVLGLLGRGGMGEVLRAHDTEHDRDVALKVLGPQWASDATYQERFRREARVVARLREPHVIPIHRYGEIDGRLFLDMRLVEGEDLAALLARTGPLDPARAVDVVGQVARALDAAHADGLLHRDVKASNVLLVGRADGADLAVNRPGEDFVYLVDFGIARSTEDEGQPALTGTGLALGSTEYMAPERFTGQPLDGRADVYSLACLLFELLTGRRPFQGVGAAEHMYAHLQEEPPAPSSVRAGLPDLLDAVVLRGLAKDREQRWTSAGGMAAAARAALSVSGVEVPRPEDGRTAPTTAGPLAPDGSRPVTAQLPRPTPDRPGPGAPPPPGGWPGSPAVPPPAPLQPVRQNRDRRPGRLGWAVAVVLALVAATLGVLLVLSERARDDDAAAATAAQQRLLRLGLPDDVDPADCTVVAGGDDALTGLRCGRSATDGGPTGATYTLYDSEDAATDVFAAGVSRLDLPQLDDDTSAYGCTDPDDGRGWFQLTAYDDTVVGRVSCTVTEPDGDSVLAWTVPGLGVIGRAELRGGGVDGVADLASWFSSHADGS
ncbi:serine/threonine-protein kinase [Goekera deserti]|uniref:serine/threonine-protein kinase n=1 Tax=Goekera deserti TaxID=2497753 RepID=UPI00192EBD1F|nr:serine/threonine-protein kinase [Goekera deserti]